MTIQVPDWLLYGIGGCMVGNLPWIAAFIFYYLKQRNENTKQSS